MIASALLQKYSYLDLVETIVTNTQRTMKVLENILVITYSKQRYTSRGITFCSFVVALIKKQSYIFYIKLL